MHIPEEVQENVRAVLLSKTDGSGILVSTLLRDYKNIVGKPLMFKNMGYKTLEEFIKELPDVCRLEYSEKDMAYKLFGIAKPSTFVSSFVKKAEGSSGSLSDREGERSRPPARKGPRVKRTSDINEKWEPNPRGLYSLCFDTKSSGLNRADIALMFAQAGEVVEINIIASGLAFVRYMEEDAAKRAIEMYGDSLKVRRADERIKDHGQKNEGRRRNNDFETSNVQNYGDLRRMGQGKRYSGNNEQYQRNRNQNNNNEQKVNGHSFQDATNNSEGSDSDWDDEFADTQIKKVHSVNVEEKQTHPRITTEVPVGEATWKRGQSGRLNPGAPRRVQNEDSLSPKQIPSSQFIQVYIGNWPNEGTEQELKSLVSKYQTAGIRMFLDKNSKNKRYAFVDCLSLEDAEQMVRELNNHIHRNRNLLVRLGNKNTLDHHSDASSIHNKMEELSIETRLHKAGLKSPAGSSQSSHHSPANSVGKGGKPSRQFENSVDDLPPLEELVSPKMPSLEGMHGYLDDGCLYDMPPIEENVPIIGAMGHQEIKGQITVLVSNFPYGTSKDELYYLFERFGIQDIVMVNQAVMKRSTYAYITLSCMEMAQEAVMSLDQMLFHGRKLTVAFTPEVAMQLDSAAQSSQEKMQRYADNAFQESPMGGRSRQTYSQSDFSARATPTQKLVTPNDYNFQLLTSKLRDYNKIVVKLCGDSELQVGMIAKLMITHIENEKFFWAQLLEDNVNGANGNLPKLQELSLRLQKPDQKQGPINNLGRCTAQFEGDWYRAWCIAETTKNGIEMSDIFFIDYGNKALLPKSEVLCTLSYLWTVPPMAIPFKLSTPDLWLPTMVNQVVTVRVREAGTHKVNFLSTVDWHNAGE